mgnify:FL=1
MFLQVSAQPVCGGRPPRALLRGGPAGVQRGLRDGLPGHSGPGATQVSPTRCCKETEKEEYFAGLLGGLLELLAPVCVLCTGRGAPGDLRSTV